MRIRNVIPTVLIKVALTTARAAVYSLLGASDGTLWIGTSDGLSSWKDGSPQEHLTARINAILEDPSHKIRATRSRFGADEGGLRRRLRGTSA